MRHIYSEAESWPLTRLQATKHWKSILTVKTLSARDRHWQNSRKRNYRELCNISACQWAKIGQGAAEAKGQQRLCQKVSALCWNQALVARLTETRLDPSYRYVSMSEIERYMTSHILQPWNNCLRTRLPFFYCSIFFAQCSLNSSSTSEQWELRTWKLGQIFKYQVMDGWAETTMIIFSSILLKFLKSKLKFFQSIRLDGFQILHFICDRFGCNLWFQSIQNQFRDCFQAFHDNI